MLIIKSEKYGTNERIKEWLAEKKKTQEKFAEDIGVDPRTVNRWFNGAKIRRNNLEKIADVMECDVDFLKCTQNYPKKCESHKIKLSNDNKFHKHLWRIRELMNDTNEKITFTINFKSETFETYEGTFIEGDTRYYFEDISPNYDGEIIYNVSINDEDPIEKTEAEIKDFVNRIIKFISFEIEHLKE